LLHRPNNQTIICASLLALAFLASLALRIAVPWDQVFTGGWIKFTDNDAYFYMRLLDNLSQHFPLLSSYDPYNIYPGGANLSALPLFFVYCMGFTAWLLGGGSPTQHTVDLVGVYFPAVLGALLVFPVFFTGRAIFNKWAGLVAAGLIALMPGEFLIRTLLGNTDSHALEIFLSTLFMLFLLLSLKAGKDLTAIPQRSGLKTILKPPVYGVLAGACLGLYVLSWTGAPLFIFISFVWLVLQTVSDHLRDRPLVYLWITGVAAYLCALLLALSGTASSLAIPSLLTALAGAAALPALSILIKRLRLRSFYYPVILIILAAAAMLALRAMVPQLWGFAAGWLVNLFAWNPGSAIAETQPLLIYQGNFTLALLWGNFTSASLMAAFALCIVLYRAARYGRPELMLLAAWSVITLLSALAMQRFAYYFAVNAALLAGYTGWLLLRLCGLRDSAVDAAVPVPAGIKVTGKKVARKRQQGRSPALMALGIAAVAFLVIYPNTGPLPGGEKPCFDVASKALYPPPDGWCQALDWLRGKTAQPFGEDGYYYDYYGKQPGRPEKEAAYSVLCWWDYGYWVTRIGQRVPLSNPGSGRMGEQTYFVATDAQQAAQVSKDWNMKYVVVNDYIVNWNTGFRVMSSAAGEGSAKYYEVYYRKQNDKLTPVLMYYPEYYRSMVVRLYCFDGKEYAPAETAAISWEAKTGADGTAYKEITGIKTFGSYGEASAFLTTQQGANWRIVGKGPLASPVPLEALAGYKPAFASTQQSRVGNNDVPAVKIFEYNP